MNRARGIRLDRRVDLEWLDFVAARVAAGDDLATIRGKLFTLLDGVLAGGTKHGSACDKTVGVLLGIWVKVPDNLVGFRDRAIEILPTLNQRERVPLHWAMLMAGYPFFGDVARTVGRLLSLQGNFASSQLNRRMNENWGDRAIITRANGWIVQSMVRWCVLANAAEMGVYTHVPSRIAVSGKLAELMLESLLLFEGKDIAVDQAARHPAMFPFDVSLRVHDLRRSARFEVHRQGLDQDVVRLVSS